MPKVQYGTSEIAYVFVEKKEQMAHYISVEKEVGVISEYVNEGEK